ncbi:50S ribosomal protein L32 [Candidatus Kaiserbacteria bacterium]|nr:50S ribosomal protein L32 [Candidatus Kaiserbacteria bacterium]
MRHNRSQVRQDRSHQALKERTLSVCSHCKALHLPHHMCLSCGWYNGRQVMDLEAEKAKRDRRLKEKRERIGVETGAEHQPAPVPAVETKDEKQPKEKARKARGAAAKRLKDESLSQSEIGSN